MKLIKSAAILLTFLLIVPVYGKGASVKDEILELHDAVENKKTKLEDLRKNMEELERELQKKQRESISLGNQISIIENRVTRTELDIESKTVEAEQVRLDIQILRREIAEREEELRRRRGVLAEILRELDASEKKSGIEILLGSETFSEFFREVNELAHIQSLLQDTVMELKKHKEGIETKYGEQTLRQERLDELIATLEETRSRLQHEQGAKALLLAYAQASEARFQELLEAIRAEAQFIENEVSGLQSRIDERLRGLDLDLGGGALITSPLNGSLEITAHFHDSTYPFRHLFEHSGTDFRAKQGSAVKASAPGIVAVARQGRLYGNYIILIHGGNLATLYAHLSHIGVLPDQFVQRGEIIGRTGGMPGTRGAGFSTGPHLHFEVRKNGIPVNPLDYLLNL